MRTSDSFMPFIVPLFCTLGFILSLILLTLRVVLFSEMDSLLLVFDGSSFMIYRRAAHPARHLLLFLVFLPADPHGLLVLRREEEYTELLMMVRLIDAHVELYVAIGEDIDLQFEGDEVKVTIYERMTFR